MTKTEKRDFVNEIEKLDKIESMIYSKLAALQTAMDKLEDLRRITRQAECDRQNLRNGTIDDVRFTIKEYERTDKLGEADLLFGLCRELASL